MFHKAYEIDANFEVIQLYTYIGKNNNNNKILP